MDIEVVSDIAVEAEVQTYTLVSDDIYVRRYGTSNIPPWYASMIESLIANSGTIANMDDVIQYLSSLESGYNTKFFNLETVDSETNALLSSLVSTTGGHTAAIASLDITKTDADSALAIAQDTVAAYFNDGSAGAFFDSKISTYASNVEANANNISVLGATLNGVSARITTVEDVTISQGLDIQTLLASTDGSVDTYYQPEAPTTANYGDWWIDTDSNPIRAYRYEDSNGLNTGTLIWTDRSTDVVAMTYINVWKDNTRIDNIIDGTTVISIDNARVGDINIAAYVASEIDKEVVVYSGSIPPRISTEPGGLHPATAKANDIYIQKTTATSASGVVVDVVNTYTYNGSIWVVTGTNNNLTALADMADGKRTIYRGTTAPTSPDVNDIWIPETGVVGYLAGGLYQWTGTVWLETTRYTDDTAVTDFITDTFLPFKDLVDAQLDNQIISWFKEVPPTLANEPASLWTTTVLKDEHLADLYYDTVSGIAYRFNKSAAGVYSWGVISDSGIGAALLAASNAQDTADGKRRVFISQPTAPYDIGDLYVPLTDNGIYLINDIWICKVSKAEGTAFSASDWKLASAYNTLSQGVTALTDTVGSLQSLVDHKIETFYQATEPHPAVTLLVTDPLLPTYETYVKDIWYDTAGTHKTYIYLNEDNSLQVDDNGLITTGSPIVINLLTITALVNDEEDLHGTLGLNGDYGDSIRYFWEEVAVPDDVFDKIDGKKTIYVIQPTSYAVNDIWIPSVDVSITGTVFLKDSVYISTANSTVFDKTHWRIATKYTDDTLAASAYGLADGKIRTWFQDDAPTALAVGYEKGDGDFWVDTNNGNLTKVWKWVGLPYPSGTGSWVDTTSTVANQALEWSATASKLITGPDGSITGWEFSDGSNQVSDFKIKATNFSVSDGTTGYTPFSISGGNIELNGTVNINKLSSSIFIGSYASAPSTVSVPMGATTYTLKDGDTYRNSTNNIVYYKSGASWLSTQGIAGTNAKIVTLTASADVFSKNTTGVVSPATIAVTGTAQNTSITTWTYSTDGITYSTTVPTGVSRTGNVVTLTGATTTSNGISIKASDGTYEDTMTIVKVEDGINGITVMMSNEAHTLPSDSAGTVTSYTGSGTIIRVYEGATELLYDGVGTANSSWNVTATGTGITAGSKTDSGAFVTIGVHSAMTTNPASVSYAISGKRVNGTAFTATKTQTLTKSIAGATGIQGIPGTNGVNGVTTYTWVKYASDASGTGLTDFPSGMTYLGMAYNKTTATESTVAADYTWSLIKGTDGIAGTNGIDGVTTYTWIKYADTSTGTGMSDTPTGKLYIGIAVNKTTATESTVTTDYTWSLIKGADGATGAAGTSTYTATVYKQTSSAPAAPSGGSYNFSTNTITPPTGWVVVQPTTTTTPTYACEYTFTATTIGATITAGTWGTVRIDAVRGTDGASGTSVNMVEVYSTSSVTPTSGAYDFSTNTISSLTAGWSMTQPASSTTPTYMSRRRFSVVAPATSATDGTWSTPVVVAQNGATGATGATGSRGAMSVFATGLSTPPTDAELMNAIAQAVNGTSTVTLIRGDNVTYTHGTAGTKQAYYTGTAWTKDVALYVNGDAVISGTLDANRINASTIAASNILVDQTIRSSDFTTIGGAGFRLKSNAAGTSADPTIYGAYISAGKMVASNIIIGGSNGTKYYDAESGYELDSAASSGIALTSNVSNPYGGTYAVDYIYFSTNYTPYSAAPLYLWGPGNHANVPMNQRVRSTTGSSQISVSISVVAQIHRVLSIWKRDSVNGTWRICGRQSYNPEGAWDTVSSIWSEKIDMPYDGWVQYGIAPYLSNGTLWGGAEPYVYYPVVVIQALNI
jgi:hypothetical protein